MKKILKMISNKKNVCEATTKEDSFIKKNISSIIET